MLLSFETGESIIYKPVCLASDALFARLLRSLSPELFRAPRYVAADRDYGFVEYVRPRPEVGTRAAAECFYFRLGALLAVAYALGATDLHMDNLLAVGEYPIPIDLEAFPYRFHSSLQDRDVTLTGLVERLARSVPATSAAQGGGAHDVLQIHAWPVSGSLHVGYRERIWRADNRPRLSGRLLQPSDYVATVVDGFNAGYHLLLSRRDRVLAEAVRVLDANEVRVRHILRYTSYYAIHIYRLLQPSRLSSVERGRALMERLRNDESAAEPLTDAIVDAEVADLLAGDIPYFWTPATGRDLRHHRGLSLPDYFRETAVDTLAECLGRLCDDDRGAQVEVLREALAASPAPQR